MTESEQNPFDCVIWGGYAWGNTGDELCLAAALERARQKFGPAVAILSHNPEYTSWLFPGTPVVRYTPPDLRPARRLKRFLRNCRSLLGASGRGHFQRHRRFPPDSEWARALFQSRRLYLAGGGYLTDLFSLDFVMAPIRYALRLKLPVATAPLGIGPFKSRHWAETVAAALKRMDLTVRDEVSRKFCLEHSVNAALQPDDAGAFAKALFPDSSQKRPPGRPQKIGVCIFPQHGQDIHLASSEWWVQVLRGLKAQHRDIAIEGFCFHTSLHYEFSEMVRQFQRAGLAAGSVLPPELDFRQAAKAIRNYDLVVSTRFHAVVVANAFGIPNAAVASGDYYLAKMNAAAAGHEEFSTVLNPIRHSPEMLLELSRRVLGGDRRR